NPADGATQFAEVTVASGETSVARFVTRPGTRRTLHLVRKSGEPVRFQTQASVTGSGDRIHLLTGDLRRVQVSEGPTVIELNGLELGTYILQVTDVAGDSHTSQFTVGSMEVDSIEIPLDW
ncbi:MAG: hypothetical protein P1V35_04440, partial [Planctomycetota bacterium]|nr:hypothetical protein [Planctomycetota bacterium]